MPRYSYETGRPYAGRLLAADKRPIENENRAIALVRLEFEIFSRDDRRRELRSLGRIASRDLVLSANAASDGGVRYFAQALGVHQAASPAAWSARAQEAWVEIVFGELDDRDGRNRFADVRPFSPDGYAVVEYQYDLADQWVTPEVAARTLKLSASTIRRRTKEYLAEYGELLERRTPGGKRRGHRRINLLLLRHLVQDPAYLDAARILTMRDSSCRERSSAAPFRQR
ncbi:MAG TPA: hypothetical protein VJ783_18315 [Pirellulales bacterium]|nr:hypothetical protein [Pirellulales bacterium]